MKSYNLNILFIVFVAVILTGAIQAQSDYETVQNFKARYDKIEESIKNAGGLDDCFAIENEIIKLKGDFAGNKDLLDNSLYPLDLNGSIDKLAADLETRRGDFAQISGLQEEVSDLKGKLNLLDRQNATLLMQIKDLEQESKNDKAKIDELKKLTDKLKSNLQEKDKLVAGIIDSLLADFVHHPFTLNDAERVSFDKKVEYNNLFFNVNRTISDNIEFVKVTNLHSDDLAELKEKQNRFSAMWHKIGPKLAEVYINRGDRTSLIERIDTRFSQWENEIDFQIWRNINSDFKKRDIKLSAYTDGEEFTNRLTGFIDDEIGKIGTRNKSESESIYHTFADTLWYGKIQSDWLPILIENNMLDEEQKDSIESKIQEWKERAVQEALPLWAYAIGIFILLTIAAGLTSIFRKRK